MKKEEGIAEWVSEEVGFLSDCLKTEDGEYIIFIPEKKGYRIAQVCVVLENGEEYDITEYVDWEHPIECEDKEDAE